MVNFGLPEAHCVHFSYFSANEIGVVKQEFSYVRFGVARSRRGTCLNLIIEYSRTILASRLG